MLNPQDLFRDLSRLYPGMKVSAKYFLEDVKDRGLIVYGDNKNLANLTHSEEQARLTLDSIAKIDENDIIAFTLAAQAFIFSMREPTKL